MSLRYALLGLLADRPAQRLALLKHFERSLGYAWPALHSQIYPELARLRDAGLIEQTGEGPRGAKEYSLTATGTGGGRALAARDDAEPRRADEALLRVFFLWLLEPEEAAAYLDREAEYQRRLLAELEGIAVVRRCPPTPRSARTGSRSTSGCASRARGIEWAEEAAREVRARSTSATAASAAPQTIGAVDQAGPKPPAASSQANETSPR